MDVGEETFRGVAICCFCRPAVKTVGSYSQAPSFELESSHFCFSVYETERGRERERERSICGKIPLAESESVIF